MGLKSETPLLTKTADDQSTVLQRPGPYNSPWVFFAYKPWNTLLIYSTKHIFPFKSSFCNILYTSLFIFDVQYIFVYIVPSEIIKLHTCPRFPNSFTRVEVVVENKSLQRSRAKPLYILFYFLTTFWFFTYFIEYDTANVVLCFIVLQ